MTNREKARLRKVRGRRSRYMRKKEIVRREKAWIEKGTKRTGYSVAFVQRSAFKEPKKR